jgi:hypothetical protein
MGLQVGFALVAGPDNRQWVAWQITDGQVATSYPPVDPDEIDQFADQLAEAFKSAGREARQANSGLVVPQQQQVHLDAKFVDDIRRMTTNINGSNVTGQ